MISMQSVIAVKDIVKSFGKLKAINNLSYSSSSGINIILGPNGAGKSTLLRCIDGLYRIDSGSVRVFGEDPYKNSDLKMKLSMLTDNYALYDFLSVEGNIKFFGRLYGLNDAEILSRAKSILKELDALQYMQNKVYTLSRGTKQKIAFCRAVINDPDVFLLDEPTAFLDAKAAQSVRRFILEYAKQGKTVLFVTQKVDEVTRFSGRISIISQGKIIKNTTTEGIYGLVLKNSPINIRLAKAVDVKFLKTIDGFVEANGQPATTFKVKIKSYKDINKLITKLSSVGAYVISVDYVEPFIEELSG